VEEWRYRVLEAHDEGGLVGSLHRRDRLEHVRGSGTHVEASLERRLHRLGVEGRTVLELDTGPKVEGVGQPIRAHLPRLRQGRDDLGRVRLVLQQAFVHREDHGVALDVIKDIRVCLRHVGQIGEPQGPP
jgi:hypothetical protein